MACVNLHSTAISHPKIAVLSDGAFRVWIAGLSYCQNHLTDGFIPEHGVHALGVKVTPKAIDELLAQRVPGKSALWHQMEGGYSVHDYLSWNDAAEDVQIRRTNLRERVRNHRNKKRPCNSSGNALRNTQEERDSNGRIQNTELRPETTDHDRGGGHLPNLAGLRRPFAGPRRPHPLEERPDVSLDVESTARADRFRELFSEQHLAVVGSTFVENYERDWPPSLRLVKAYSDRELSALLGIYLIATGQHFDGKPKTIGRMAEAASMIEAQMRRESQWPAA
jgi:hypothetical protein